MNWHISCVNSYMKLYIISNRLPVKVTKEDETFVFSRSEGGLATGLDSLQISYEKHWIGWPGICVDNEESKEEITSRLEGINFHPVFLSEIQIKNYYEGYSNSTIWPKIPVINVERCIGCGACENLCPARLFSAIYVEGHERHRII